MRPRQPIVCRTFTWATALNPRPRENCGNTAGNDSSARYERLSPLVGCYWSDEAETMPHVTIESGARVLKRRPDAVIQRTVLGPDTFQGVDRHVTFIRNS